MRCARCDQLLTLAARMGKHVTTGEIVEWFVRQCRPCATDGYLIEVYVAVDRSQLLWG